MDELRVELDLVGSMMLTIFNKDDDDGYIINVLQVWGVLHQGFFTFLLS